MIVGLEAVVGSGGASLQVETASPHTPAGVATGQPLINFAAHQVRAGNQGAREDFETMIGQLVRAIHPGARMIAANPGDWGIDVLVGELGGAIAVWQSKYFVPEVDKAHQRQINESFKSVCENAEKQGFKVAQWTLCVPSSMDGPTAKWWDGWKKRNQKSSGIKIVLWDETELRHLLITPDADDVRRHYYEPIAQPFVPAQRALVELADHEAERLNSALFVRQLQEAGHSEVSAAKHQFFNAEILAREIVDKGVASETAALASADASVHAIWEDRFNEACLASEQTRLAGFHRSVMNEIRSEHPRIAEGLRSGPTHSCGLMHRIVDDRRAGWVRHWRDLADSDSSKVTSAETPTSAMDSLPPPECAKPQPAAISRAVDD
jgi:hypothetical protein